MAARKMGSPQGEHPWGGQQEFEYQMKTALKMVAGLLVAAVLLWLFFRGVDLQSLGTALGEARWGWLVVCLGMALLHFLVRAWRWQLLLAPIRRGVSLRALTEAILAGYAVTFLIPARLGELVRPSLLARRERLPLPATLATVGLDRLLDGATLTVFLVAFLLFSPGAANGIPESVAGGMRFWGLLIGGGMFAALVVLGVLSANSHWLPAAGTEGGWRSRLLGFMHSALAGMKALHGARPLAGAILGSLAIWLVLAVQAYAGMRAFAIDLPFFSSFGLVAALAVGIALPTPAGAGGYHAAGAAFLQLVYQVGEAQAVAAILILHLISVVPAIILGSAVLAREGVSLGDLLRRQQTSVVAEEPT